MQSRLEEEEDAKVALMSRIQRLTKLILVSSKNTIPGYMSEIPNHQRSHSFGEDEVSSFSLSLSIYIYIYILSHVNEGSDFGLCVQSSCLATLNL